MNTTIIVFSILTFLAGLPTAWAFGRYLINVEKRRATKAAAWDFVILTLAQLVTLNLWARADDSAWVLMAWILGNVVGTYLVIRNQHKKDNGKDENSDMYGGITAER